MGRINTVLQDLESFTYFRNAVYSSYGNYTSYKYIEGSQTWHVYSEVAPEILLTYTIKKGTDEESVFLAEKNTVDNWAPRKRVDANVTDFDLAATEAEHYTQLGDAINNIRIGLDGYYPDITGTEHYSQISDALNQLFVAADGYGQGLTEIQHYQQHSEAIDLIRQAVDGYASDQTVSEHYHQHSEAIQTILSSLDGYTNSNFGTEYWYNERLDLYSTTSINWREVVNITTGSLPAGNYRVGWSAELGCNNGNKIPYMQVQVDNDTVIGDHTMRFAHNEGYSAHAGFAKITLGAGVHTIDMDINASDSGSYATRIRKARLELWRIS